MTDVVGEVICLAAPIYERDSPPGVLLVAPGRFANCLPGPTTFVTVSAASDTGADFEAPDVYFALALVDVAEGTFDQLYLLGRTDALST